MKNILKLDFIIFAVGTLCLWILSSALIIRDEPKFNILRHNGIDQHTLQALAWQKGQFYIDNYYENLELARYKGKIYNSFPATPTLIEFPFALFFKRNTPNNLVQMVFTWLSMLLSFFILEKITGNRVLSFLAAFIFFFGTNIFYLSLTAPVWHQGHMYGIFFSILAFFILFFSAKPYQLVFGAIALGLSVGCRPFYILYVPLYFFLATKKYPIREALLWIFIGLIPPGLYTGLLNYLRFDSPTTFGHVFLEYSMLVDYDVFGPKYLPPNLYHAFLKLPDWVDRFKVFQFHGRGNAIWLVSPFMFTGFVAFFRKEIHLYDKILAGTTIFAVWALLLLHCGNGWFQFGYRYGVDLIPLFILLFAWGFKKLPVWLIPVGLYSIVINYYGAYWFYHLIYNLPL